MPATFRLTLAQLNPVLGDFAANEVQAREAWEEGRRAGADMVALPEMFLTGYQPQDLVMKRAFVKDAMAAVEVLAADLAEGPALGIGAPVLKEGRVYNAWHVLQGGKIATTLLKHELPNDTVFDEKRVFAAADIGGPYRIGPLRIGTPICEDAWYPDVPETLAHKLELFRRGGKIFRDDNELFSEPSWTAVLVGQGLVPEEYHPFADTMRDAEVVQMLARVKGNIARLVGAQPPHAEYLAQHCGIASS